MRVVDRFCEVLVVENLTTCGVAPEHSLQFLCQTITTLSEKETTPSLSAALMNSCTPIPPVFSKSKYLKALSMTFSSVSLGEDFKVTFSLNSFSNLGQVCLPADQSCEICHIFLNYYVANTCRKSAQLINAN